jgi:YD repeat-containing protein
VVYENTGIAIWDADGVVVERYEPLNGRGANRLAWIDRIGRVAVPVQPREIRLVPNFGATTVLSDPELALDPRSVLALPDGEGLIVNYTDGSIWPWSSGKRATTALVTADTAGAEAEGGMSLTLDAAGRRLAVTRNDDRVRIYDRLGQQPPVDLPLRASGSVTVAYAPTGPRFAVLGSDGRLHLWEVGDSEATSMFSVAAAPKRTRAGQTRSPGRAVTWLTWWDADHLLLSTVAGNVQVLNLVETDWHARASALGLTAE